MTDFYQKYLGEFEYTQGILIQGENTHDSSDEEFKSFVEETSNVDVCSQISENIQIDENISDKTTRQKSGITKVESSEDLDLGIGIDFSKMENVTESNTHKFVVHNDMDLKDLHKFVRKKNVKFEKFKTEEHTDSDGTSDSSSTDGNESDFNIPQGDLNFFLVFSKRSIITLYFVDTMKN